MKKKTVKKLIAMMCLATIGCAMVTGCGKKDETQVETAVEETESVEEQVNYDEEGNITVGAMTVNYDGTLIHGDRDTDESTYEAVYLYDRTESGLTERTVSITAVAFEPTEALETMEDAIAYFDGADQIGEWAEFENHYVEDYYFYTGFGEADNVIYVIPKASAEQMYVVTIPYTADYQCSQELYDSAMDAVNQIVTDYEPVAYEEKMEMIKSTFENGEAVAAEAAETEETETETDAVEAEPATEGAETEAETETEEIETAAETEEMTEEATVEETEAETETDSE